MVFPLKAQLKEATAPPLAFAGLLWVADGAGAVAFALGLALAVGALPAAMSTVPAPWSRKIGPHIANVTPAGVTFVGYASLTSAFVGTPNAPLPKMPLTASSTA